LKFAKQATSDTDRQSFVDMARTWMQAAMQLDDSPKAPAVVTEITKEKSAA
jgi:hypothetical protein